MTSPYLRIEALSTIARVVRHRIVARPPDSPVVLPAVLREADDLAGLLEDAAHLAGGHAAGVARPRTEGEVAALLRGAVPVLPIGAQSSVTGGATPMGEVLLSTAAFRRIGPVSADPPGQPPPRGVRGDGSVRVQAGVALADLEAALEAAGWTYPPAPTCTAATVGGIVATNAAGPATFKHGVTRDWVAGLTVVLPGGDVLDLSRGEVTASPDGVVELATAGGRRTVPIGALRWPDVPKRSAGYALTAGLDLVDLFIGAEGTLGVVTEVTLRVAARRTTRVRALVPCESEHGALALVAQLRALSHETWRRGVPGGIDVAAVEHLDARSLAIVREDGADRRHHLALPDTASVLLLVDLDLPAGTSREAAWAQVEGALEDGGTAKGPLARFCRLVADHGLLDAVELAMPGDTARVAQMDAVREAVPAGVNARIASARALHGAAVKKTAADMIVPWDRFPEMLGACRRLFEARGLDYAIWGHVSDGNVHPNVLPRCAADVEAGVEAILALGREVIAMGGCPLAEHGVGRHPLKKALLRMLHGEDGLAAMRAVKAALDPEGRLAPGVLL